MAKPPVNSYFEALIDFGDNHFSFSRDCVGSEVRFKFKDQNFILCFPNFDFSELDGFDHPKVSLKGTRIVMNWLINDSMENTVGRETARNINTKEVLKFGCNQIIVRSWGKMTSVEMRLARKRLKIWRKCFISWMEVANYVDLEASGFEVQQDSLLEAFAVSNDITRKGRRLKERSPQSISIVANFDSQGTTKAELQKALKLSSSGDFPPGYYILLLNALKHFNEKKYRQCVLDAATAFEMSLTQLSDMKLANLKEQEKKLIENKYQGISNLVSALKELGVKLPSESEIVAKISRPRNQAIHKGAQVTRSQAGEALDFVKTFIYSALPY